jgi:Nif-specific regulatory protein
MIRSGRGVPALYELHPDQSVTLGRNHDNTIVLYDEHVSRFHATIFHDGGHWFIRDLKTRNGTRVNGTLIEPQTELDGEQEISIGDIRLLFSTGLPAAVTPSRSTELTQSPVRHLPPEPDPTVFQRDELNALYRFMAGSIKESDSRELIQRALEAVVQQTGASLVGFLSLDTEDPLPRVVLPKLAKVDLHLSRQLTQRVQREGRAVWLRGQAGVEREAESESLVAFTDALCLPLPAEDGPLGALHAYHCGGRFSERDLHFCEILAGHLANSLALLRLRRSLEAENSRLRGRAPVADELIGDSPVMRQLREMIARVAPARTTVLIQGNTGSGKELVARALHKLSARSAGPLVAVNCAAIAPSLMDAELFGYRKSAFTGADRDHPGYFEQADGGTLFLDEVGELSLECQAKLLRIIEGKGFRPIGATAELVPDVRITAATNRDLEREARAGKFREDLYFRLRVVRIVVPALREHPEDIPPLAEFFLAKLGSEWHRRLRLTEAALRRLGEYSWRGNVRQLFAVLESAAALSDRDLLDVEDLRLDPEAPSAESPSLNLDDLEAWAIRQALRRTEGNATQAARLLGVTRDTMCNKMKKFHIEREDLD